MRKNLFLLAAAALSLVGCNKDAVNEIGGKGAVTFTVLTEGAVTKASADGDGAKIDEVKVAVYMKTNSSTEPYKLYDNPDATYVSASKSATFTVNMIKNQTYQIVVWADKSGSYDFNNTLQSITRNSAVSESCNKDELDAFYASVEYNQATATAEDRVITAKRPFAQLNLITTDLKEGFVPGAMTVKYTAPQKFNAFDGKTFGDPESVTYSADAPYNTTISAEKKNTLVMDYLFASTEGDVLSEVVMTAQLTETITDTFNNIPVKRNFRTNVIGALLTDPTDFTVNVNADWGTSEIEINYTKVDNVKAANEVLADSANAGKDIAVEVTMPKDTESQQVTFTTNNNGVNAIFKFEDNFAEDHNTVTFKNDGESTTTGPASVTIEAPAGTNLVFENETHAIINGTSYGVISGTFSASTLVINKGVNVQKIIMTAGGLEIHGNVEAFEAAADHGEIIVRECEGLSTEVKEALSPYICSGYEAFEVEGKWNIADHSVCSIGSVKYLTLARAIEAAQADDVINILSDINVENSSISLAGRNFAIGVGKSLIINGNGYTVKNTSNSPRALFGVCGSNEDLINVTFKNIKLESVAERVIETRGYIASITLDNADLISKYPYNATAFQIGGNQSSKAKVTIKNSSIVAGNSGYPYLSYNPADVILEESTLSGYCGLYFKSPSSSAGSRGSVVTAKKSKFECPNLFEAAGQNSFGVFVCEDDDITVSLENCITHAEQYGTARQNAFVLSSEAKRCEKQCTFNITGDGSLIGALIKQSPIAWGSDPKYTITIKGGTFTDNPSYFVPNGYEVVENGDGTYSVVKGAPVAPDWAAVPTPTVVVNDQAALEAAISAVPEGGSAVIGLGNGEFTTYGKGLSTQGKNFTFVGAGVENTVWKYGNSSEASGEGASDYSFDGSGDLKFCNLTLSDNCTTKNYYRGFVRSKSFTCVGCKITNVISYMYGPVKFYSCEFVTEVADSFNVKLYAGTSFEFDTCTFKSPYGFIDAYRQNTRDGWLDCIVTNCTFIGTASSPASKPAVRLCDYTANGEGGFWNVYFNGTNTATNIAVDSTTGSNLYGSRFYTGYTPYGAKVYFDNNLVWEHK